MKRNLLISLLMLSIISCKKSDFVRTAHNSQPEVYNFNEFHGKSPHHFFISLRTRNSDFERSNYVKLLARYDSNLNKDPYADVLAGDILIEGTSIAEEYGDPLKIEDMLFLSHSGYNAELQELFGTEIEVSVLKNGKRYEHVVKAPNEFIVSLDGPEPVFNITNPDVKFTWSRDDDYPFVTILARWSALSKSGKFELEPGRDQVTIADNGFYQLDESILKDIPKEVRKVRFEFIRHRVSQWQVADETAEIRLSASCQLTLFNTRK